MSGAATERRPVVLESAAKLLLISNRLHRAYGDLPSNVFPGPPGDICRQLNEISAALIAASTPADSELQGAAK